MSFFSRVMNHLLNEVLVNGLANSRTFQRFAVKSNAMMQEMAKKSAEKQAKLGETAQGFAATFKEELKKGMEDISKQQQQPRPPPR